MISFTGMASDPKFPREQEATLDPKINLMKELIRKGDVEIQYYGKIIDQNGAPVVDADVEIHIKRFSPSITELFSETKKLHLKTDVDGCFSLPQKERGSLIFINQVQKIGYEFSYLQNRDRGVEYSDVTGQVKIVPDKARPRVFYMRKKGATTFVIEGRQLGIGFSASNSGTIKGYDCFHNVLLENLAHPVFNGELFVCDLQVSATVNTNKGTWSVVLSPGNAGGGIIATNQLLYEAPRDGYQPEWSFIPCKFKIPENNYLYMRSRDPAVYTRIEIVHINVDEKHFRLSGRSVMNPYGERNLEQATDLPFAVWKQLKDELRAAYRHGSHPATPDLPKLIKEAKERAASESIK